MPRRTFSAEFKRKVVEEHLKGGKRVSEICREYQLSDSLLRSWREKYQANGLPGEASREDLTRELREAQRRIEQLEGALGRASMELDFMKRAFKRAGIPFPSGPRS
jgi:transposase